MRSYILWYGITSYGSFGHKRNHNTLEKTMLERWKAAVISKSSVGCNNIILHIGKAVRGACE